MIDDRDDGPWYQQRWAWFVLMPLIVVVVACIFFVGLAFKHADDVVIDNYYKEGRTINQRFEQDAQAEVLQLTGELRFDLSVGEVLLSIRGEAEFPEQLTLLLNHPISEEFDQRVLLHKLGAGRYRGDLESQPQHRWYLRLLPVADVDQQNTADWRLNGEIDFALSDTVGFGNP